MTIEFLPKQLIANATLNSNEVKEIEESENKDIQSESEVSPIALYTRAQPTSLTDVVFTVKGVRYSNGNDERFKIKFDISKKLFKVTNTGLEVVTNDAPTITIGSEAGYTEVTENNETVWKKTIKRGDDIDLAKGITVSDTFAQVNHIPVLLDYSVFNNMKLGEQTVIYILTDSWGARVTKKAIITV